MIKTYNEPARARKQCPKCSTYVHARTIQCNCGYEFKRKNLTTSTNITKTTPIPKDLVQEPKTYDKPGPGKRLCLKCNLYYGAKQKRCPKCGFLYVKELVSVIKQPKIPKVFTDDTIVLTKNYIGSLVYTPSGSCPLEIPSTIEEIPVWCSELFNLELRNKRTLTWEAIWYYCSQSNNSEEFRNAIRNWCFSEGYEKTVVNSKELEESTNEQTETLLVLN